MQNAGIKTEEETIKKQKDWWKDSDEENSSSDSEEDNGAVSASDSDVDEEKPRRKEKRVYGMMHVVIPSFKTLEQLLQEQNRGEEAEEAKPIVFTDHTGRQAQSRVLGMEDVSKVNRDAVGFEVLVPPPPHW